MNGPTARARGGDPRRRTDVVRDPLFLSEQPAIAGMRFI